MYTLVITNIDLIYFVCLGICSFTAHRIGVRTGAQAAVSYLEDNGMLNLDDEKTENGN